MFGAGGGFGGSNGLVCAVKFSVDVGCGWLSSSSSEASSSVSGY